MIELTFLVVDDSQTVRNLICRAIKTRIGGKAIFEAEDGKKALEILKKEDVDFILSDWEMPHMTGEEFLYEVRQNPDWKEIPFIMITSHHEKDFIVTAMQNGVSNYIVKPFSALELEDKLRRTWSGGSRRKAERYYNFPEHRMVIKSGGKVFPGKVLNLSRLGASIELEYRPELQLCKLFEMAIEFETGDENGVIAATNLLGLATRIELKNSFSPSSKTCHMGLWFGAKTIDPKVEENLNKMIKWLAAFSPDIIKDEEI